MKNPSWGMKTNQHNIFFSDLFTIKRVYKKTFGFKPDLDNPALLTEKIQWLKLNDRSTLHTVCADKIAVRKHVAQKIGAEYLIPIFSVYDSVDELSLESLPDEPFIIKTNHDSGGGISFRNKNDIDIEDLKRSLNERLAVNHYNVSGEWPYKDIPPRILVEKLLVTSAGGIPNDYKVHCFNGRAQFIGVDVKTAESHHRNYYDPSWASLDFEWPSGKCPRGHEVEKPPQLVELIRLAEKLSADFCYVRIDFYLTSYRILFGEITFYDTGGFGRFSPAAWDGKLGELLDLHRSISK
ncbi:MAG: hypothetical protein HKM98_01015 [Gammaproteobacteria bacterium]|nr:hypothetical protein [Gammaproteobacteria bacterium]